jgi:hypothetical protein
MQASASAEVLSRFVSKWAGIVLVSANRFSYPPATCNRGISGAKDTHVNGGQVHLIQANTSDV